jgi:hypothetical protein
VSNIIVKSKKQTKAVISRDGPRWEGKVRGLMVEKYMGGLEAKKSRAEALLWYSLKKYIESLS